MIASKRYKVSFKAKLSRKRKANSKRMKNNDLIEYAAIMVTRFIPSPIQNSQLATDSVK